MLLFGLLFMLPAAFADGTKDKGQFVQGLGTGGKSWLISMPVYPFISLRVALAILAPTMLIVTATIIRQNSQAYPAFGQPTLILMDIHNVLIFASAKYSPI